MKKHKIWRLATLLLLLGIAAVFIFLDQNAELQQLEKETAESDKLRQERNKPQETPQVVDVSDNTQRPPPPGETHQTGYWRGDNWHKTEPINPNVAQNTKQGADKAEIPEDMPMPDIPLPADLQNMDWKQWSQKHLAEWKKYIHALDPAIERLGRETETLWANMPPKDSPDYVAAKAKWNATMLEQNQLIDEQGWRIHQADASGEAAFDKYKLARFGKK